MRMGHGQRYKQMYTAKELQTAKYWDASVSTGLEMYDFDSRFYDSHPGRWFVGDYPNIGDYKPSMNDFVNFTTLEPGHALFSSSHSSHIDGVVNTSYQLGSPHFSSRPRKSTTTTFLVWKNSVGMVACKSNTSTGYRRTSLISPLKSPPFKQINFSTRMR